MSALLQRASGSTAPLDRRGAAAAIARPVVMELAGASIPGELCTTRHMKGLVLLAHVGAPEQGASCNRHLAQRLHRCSIGTLSFNLLTDNELADAHGGIDVGLQARRIDHAVRWAAACRPLPGVPYGLAANGTGAAAALEAAACMPGHVAAIVSYSGRPDLAWRHLPRVRAPTLLMVGDRAPAGTNLHRAALHALQCAKRLEVIPGAGDLMTDALACEGAAALAAQWLQQHLHPRRVW